MIRLLKVLVILALLAAIAAGGYASYYFIILKPRELDRQEQTAASQAQATPEPRPQSLDTARALRAQRRYDEARQELETFLGSFPESFYRGEAETLLGDINYNQLFSGQPGPDKTLYVVKPGDVIDRVAHKMKSSPELIFRANNLNRIILQIGQKLQVPQVDFSIEVRLGEKKLILLNKGAFFKSYPILDARPLPKKTKEIRTKVHERLAFKDGKRVAFGSKEYPDSLRSVSLFGQPNYTIYGKNFDGSPDTAKPAAGGIALDASDAEEVQTLVNAGTPVVISAE